ncbi:MAG: hypothetical protein ABI874_07330, partial [Chloroflexota bacterium]
MDQPQKSLLTALTILAAIAGIFGCIFAAPPFILSLRNIVSMAICGAILSSTTIGHRANCAQQSPIS